MTSPDRHSTGTRGWPGPAEPVRHNATAPADLLGVPVGAPLLRAERTTRDTVGSAVLLSDAVFNPLLTELVVDLPPTGDAEPAGLRLLR